MRLNILAISAVFLATACANPHVVPPLNADDRAKECAAIEADIAQTEQYRKDARAEDKFQWKYVLVVNAATSWVRMNKAEEAAEKRLAELKQLQAQKCHPGATPAMVAPAPIAPAPIIPETPMPQLQPQAGDPSDLPVGAPIE